MDNLLKLSMADAEEFLEEAKILYQYDKFRGILNRCYYSYFWLVKGLLHQNGQHIKTHQGVETKFFELYIKNEEIPKKYHTFLKKLGLKRESADYEMDEIFDKEDADEALEMVEDFMKYVKEKYIID